MQKDQLGSSNEYFAKDLFCSFTCKRVFSAVIKASSNWTQLMGYFETDATFRFFLSEGDQS